MPTYAKTTTVSPEKSRMEIEQTLVRYGAEKFMYATEPGRALVMFEIKGRTVRFTNRPRRKAPHPDQVREGRRRRARRRGRRRAGALHRGGVSS